VVVVVAVVVMVVVVLQTFAMVAACYSGPESWLTFMVDAI